MGAFKKLKDILFDIEEESIPIITKEDLPKQEKNYEENPIKEIKIPKKEEDLIHNIEKKDTRFNFPLDFDEELSRTKKNINDYEFSKPKYDRLNTYVEPKRKDNKNFKPSPIISPVYGILDQNYTKDDVIVKSDIGVKAKELDEVRKKAYGINDNKNLKEDVKKEAVKTGEDTTVELKTLDELLIEKKTVKESIKVSYNDELNNNVIEQTTQDEIIDESDAMETDLFNLIDSMYEERKEREEEGQ